MKNNLNQSSWETYFYASSLFFLITFFTMMLEGSREIEMLPYVALLSMFNLLACIWLGLKPSEKEDNN